MQKIRENVAKMLQSAEKLQAGEGEVKSPHLNYPTTGVEYHAQNREIKRVLVPLPEIQ